MFFLLHLPLSTHAICPDEHHSQKRSKVIRKFYSCQLYRDDVLWQGLFWSVAKVGIRFIFWRFPPTPCGDKIYSAILLMGTLIAKASSRKKITPFVFVTLHTFVLTLCLFSHHSKNILKCLFCRKKAAGIMNIGPRIGSNGQSSQPCHILQPFSLHSADFGTCCKRTARTSHLYFPRQRAKTL